MNKKGFLFTISVVLFASTLLFFSQNYLNENIGRETMILRSYSTSSEPFLNDDLSFDIERIFDLDIKIGYEANKIEIIINDSLPKQYSVSNALTNYASFLNNTFFARIKGTQTIDLTNINDGSLEVFFDDNFSFTHNYDSPFVSLTSNGITLSSVDLNLDYNGSLSSYTWTRTAGIAPVVIRYEDDVNSFTISDLIDPSNTSTLVLLYSDSNTTITLGDTGTANSFKIDTNSTKITYYDINLTYSFDANFLPVKINSILSHSDNRIDSNSYLKILN